MQLVKILDLAEMPQPLNLKADLRTRLANGDLKYPDQQEKPQLGILTEVKIKMAGPCCGQGKGPKVRWLYWYHPGISCGYSGHRMDAGADQNYLLVNLSST